LPRLVEYKNRLLKYSQFYHAHKVQILLGLVVSGILHFLHYLNFTVSPLCITISVVECVLTIIQDCIYSVDETRFKTAHTNTKLKGKASHRGASGRRPYRSRAVTQVNEVNGRHLWRWLRLALEPLAQAPPLCGAIGAGLASPWGHLAVAPWTVSHSPCPFD
jgi:hypothetical protein